MRLSFFYLLSLVFVTTGFAQSADRQARVPLNMYVISYQAQSGTPTASITFNGETVTASGDRAQSAVLDTTVDVSKTYTLSSTFSLSHYAKVHIESPGREWIVYVDGEPMNGPIYIYSGALSHEISVLPKNQLRAPAGVDSGLKLGSIHWEVSAGMLPSGKSAGNIYLKSEDVHANLHRPASLNFVNHYPSEVAVFRNGSGELNYIQTPSTLIHIWFSTSYNSTYIDFLKEGQFTPGVVGGANPAINSGASHFVRYRINDPSDGDLYIEQQAFGTAIVAKRYHVRKSGNDWFYKSGLGPNYGRFEKRSFSAWNTQYQLQDEIVEVGNGFNGNNVSNIISQTKNVWGRWKVGTADEWSKIVTTYRDPWGKEYRDDFVYYTGGETEGVYGKLKSHKAFDGSWEKYDYFGDPTSGQNDKRGLIRRVYSPSMDGNVNVLTNNNGSPGVSGFSGFVTEYDYIGSDGSNSDEDFEMSDLPTSRTTYLNNKLMGKTTYDYSESSSTILVTKIHDFASDGSNDYLESIDKRYRTGYSDEKISELPYSINGADKTRTVFGYKWESDTKEFFSFELSGTHDPQSQTDMNADLITHVTWSGISGNLDTENLYLVPFQSIMVLTTRDIRGYIKSTKSYVYIGDANNNGRLNNGDVQLLSSISYTYNDLGAVLTETNDINGLKQTITYDNRGRIRTREDASGLVTTYADYNALGIPETLTQTGVNSSLHGSGASVDLLTLHYYDALGRLTYSIRDGGGEMLTQEFGYDLGGMRTLEVLPCGKRFVYTPQKNGTHYRQLKISEQNLDGSTEYRSHTQHFYLDGSLKSISGNAKVNLRNTYEVTAQGQMITFTDFGTTGTHGGNGDKDGREAITVSDWLGRTVGEYTKAMPNGINGTNIQHHHNGDKWLLNRYVYGANGQPQAGKLYQDLTYLVDRANFRQELAPTSASAPSGAAQSRNRNLYAYDRLGQLLHQALDLDNNSQIDISATQLDRLTTFQSYAEKWGSNWWWIDASYVYNENGNSTPYTVTSSFTMSRFSGFNKTNADRTIAETRVFKPMTSGYASNTDRMTTITQKLDSAIKGFRTETETAGASNTAVERSNILGQLYAQDTGAVNYYNSFDVLGRLTQTVGDRGVKTSYEYLTDSPKVHRELDHFGDIRREYTYKGCGLLQSEIVHSVSGSGTRTSIFEYNDRQQMTHKWGNGTEPVKYTYDAYGDRTQMTLYGNGSTSFTSSSTTVPNIFETSSQKTITEWTFDEGTGLLVQKKDPQGKVEKYSYGHARGHLHQVIKPSGTISYNINNNTWDLEHVDYSGNTTSDIRYTYFPNGQVKTVQDALGTRTLGYSARLELTSERFGGNFYGSQRVIAYNIDNYGRSSGVSFRESGEDYDVDIDYTFSGSSGRLSGIVAEFEENNASRRTYTYQYYGNSNRVRNSWTATPGVGNNQKYHNMRSYPSGSNDIDRAFNGFATSATPSLAGNFSKTVANFYYTYTGFKQVDQVARNGSMFSSYGDAISGVMEKYQYDTRGRLTRATTYKGNPDAITYHDKTDLIKPLDSAQYHALHGRDWTYAYDVAGNRTEEKRDGRLVNDYTVNGTQYSAIAHSRDIWVQGTSSASGGEDLVVYSESQGMTAPDARSDQYFSALFDFSGTSINQDLFKAIAESGGQFAVDEQRVNIPPASESRAYDNQGNLTASWAYNYQWDLEDRLIKISPKNGSNFARNGAKAYTYEMKYDYMDRMVELIVKEHTGNGSNWNNVTTIRDRKFVYHGWDMILEMDASSHNNIRGYTWGLDLAESLGGAGGTRGLLGVVALNGTHQTYFPAYDGMGHIYAMVDASNGLTVAEYEYDPYGKTIRATGSKASDLPFGYSTRFTFREIDLIYYGYRFYDPEHGRFLNKDPIGEAGGNNLYAAFDNDPINKIDILGLDAGPVGLNRDNQPFAPWGSDFGVHKHIIFAGVPSQGGYSETDDLDELEPTEAALPPSPRLFEGYSGLSYDSFQPGGLSNEQLLDELETFKNDPECDEIRFQMEEAKEKYGRYLSRFNRPTTSNGGSSGNVAEGLDSIAKGFDMIAGIAGVIYPDNSLANGLGAVSTAVNIGSSLGKIGAGLGEGGNPNLIPQGISELGTTAANAAGTTLFQHISGKRSVRLSTGRVPVSSAARAAASRANPSLILIGAGIALAEYNFTARSQAEKISIEIQGIHDSGRIAAGYREKYQDLKSQHENCVNGR